MLVLTKLTAQLWEYQNFILTDKDLQEFIGSASAICESCFYIFYMNNNRSEG